MTEPNVRVSRVGTSSQIAVVELSRRAKRNALDDSTLERLIALTAEIEADQTIRCAVLTGGEFFSSGGDLNLGGNDDESREEAFRRRGRLGQTFCSSWAELPQFTIAAVEGGAVGGGLSLALCCDLRVIASDGWVWVPEARNGFFFGWNSLARLVDLVGPAKAKQICVLAERHSAQECIAWRLVDEVVPHAQTLPSAIALAERAVLSNRTVVQRTKEAIYEYSRARSLDVKSDADHSMACYRDPGGIAARTGAER